MPLTVGVEVPPRDREVLGSWTRSPSIRARLARRARIVLLAADGAGTNEDHLIAGASALAGKSPAAVGKTTGWDK